MKWLITLRKLARSNFQPCNAALFLSSNDDDEWFFFSFSPKYMSDGVGELAQLVALALHTAGQVRCLASCAVLWAQPGVIPECKANTEHQVCPPPRPPKIYKGNLIRNAY